MLVAAHAINQSDSWLSYTAAPRPTAGASLDVFWAAAKREIVSRVKAKYREAVAVRYDKVLAEARKGPGGAT
jgi:hypothetical protein